MGLSLRPRQVRRYRDIARLLVKYGHSDLVTQAGLDEVERDPDLPEPAAGDAEQLATDLERLGPTFVKLGQLLSTRVDLLPPAYVQALSRLQDDIAPFGFDEVERIVEAELGVRMSRAFLTFDNVPLASASLGQVHRATLRNGRAVAVKIQRPSIRDAVLDDLDALRDIAEIADAHTALGRRYGFAPLLAEFRKSMLRELDYLQEAANLEMLAANLASFDRIHVPRPVADYTTARVLTMDFVGGRKLTSLGPLAQLEVDGTALADQLVSAYLQQILVDGFFHADPHPGNVFLTDTGDIALIDLGMVGRVSPDVRERLLKMLLAVGNGRGPDVAASLRALAQPAGDREVDDAEFTRTVTALVSDHQGLPLSRRRAGAVVVDLTKVATNAGLRPPPELTMLGRALLALDEITRTLDPRYDPDAAIRTKASELIRGRLKDSASQGNLLSAVLEAKEFAERLPSRLNKLLDTVASGEVTLRVRGVDEHAILHGVQQLANRITTGLVIAALIVGAAMLMRVPTRATLFGYPALAIVCFVMAAAFGVALLASIWLGGRRTRR